MNRKKFEEFVQLYFLNELTDEEKIEVENYIAENDDAKAEFEGIRELHSALISNRPAQVQEEELRNVRASLLRTLRSHEERISPINKFVDRLTEFLFGNYKAVLGGAAALVIGILIGQNISTNSNFLLPGQSVDDFNLSHFEKQGLNLSNIRFEESNGNPSEVEISFDAVKPLKYKGSVNDELIQLLLAKALVTSKNPGLRIKTVNTLSSRASFEKPVDPKVKAAFLTALKADENPAVRKEALNALRKFPFDSEIRDAVLYVLSHDENSGMRVAAINALAELKLNDQSIDKEIKSVLKNTAASEENEFIKLRAASLIGEVK
jgi:hypothetical protein